MLDAMRIATPTGVIQPVTDDLSGRRLSRLQKTLNVADRALMANELHLGHWRLVDPTIRQAAGLFEVCSTSVVMAKAVATKCDLFWAVTMEGMPLAEAYHQLHPRPVSDQEVAEVVRRAGHERTWNALVAVL
jgi:hypothetical protein